MPLGLFRGVRTFTLAPEGVGATRFTMREAYSGPLAPLIGRSIPDLGPSFRRLAAGLKARVESAAAPAGAARVGGVRVDTPNDVRPLRRPPRVRTAG